MREGRPLRFLGAAVLGWTAIRAAMLWPGAEPLAPLIGKKPAPPVAVVPRLGEAPGHPTLAIAAEARPFRTAPVRPMRTALQQQRPPVPIALPVDPMPSPARPPAILFAPFRPTPIAHGPGRLAGSAWTLVRGGPSGTLSGGQLGASQAGVRLTYALGHARRVALTARLATPLEGAGKEAALGIEWKPTRLPFRLIAEQRFALDGGRGGPTVGVIGGYGPADVTPGLRIEAYGQAGAIARGGVEGFVDSAARLTHPTARIGHARLDLGVGVWGSAQRGAARFDLGPTAGLAVPVAGRNLRLALDWRERVAGGARPGSGPAFTIGSDF